MSTYMHHRKAKTRHKNRLIFFALGIAILALISARAAFNLFESLPGPESITERSIAESTKIYDRTGEVLLYEIHGEEKRTVVTLAEIPDYIREATLVAEDVHFYEHWGLDFKGIARAALKNLLGGEITQGGSTITQQLVKKALLTDERTYTRKIKEAVLSILIERKYSKDEILEWYLNQIPYGSNAYGVAAASKTFFGKDVRDLTVPEAALLASLPKAPTYFSPYGSNKDELIARKNWILDRMAEASFISTEDATKFKNAKIILAPPKQTIRAPHFIMYVREILNEKYGEEFIEKGGLKVITTLNWDLQQEGEKVILEGAKQNEKNVQAANASLVAIDPKSGEILTMVGSKNYWGEPEPLGCDPGVNCRFDPHVNITTRLRQPGSAFKPFVYATAFAKGYTPETVLFDVLTEFNPSCGPEAQALFAPNGVSECYHPHNYDGKFRGPVTLRQALAQSLNVPSVKLLYLAGIKDSIQTAENLKISSLGDPNRYGLTLVLGGAEVKLLEMTTAFGAFANDGRLYSSSAILKIENSKGEMLEEKKNEAETVLDPEVARTLNSVLSDNKARQPVFSPTSSLYFPNRDVAAKTGTTQDYRDAWVIGYTPNLVAGVWVGNNDNSPMHQSSVSIMVAGPLWHKFLEEALKTYPNEDFPPPSPKPSPENPALRGIYRSGEIIKIDKISKKLATQYTPLNLMEEIGTGEIKSILSFINKDNPPGLRPSEPIQDAQFKNWIRGIYGWLSQNSLPEIITPKESDDIHVPEKFPKLELILPDTLLSSSLSQIPVKIMYTFPLQELSLFVDAEFISSRTAPFVTSVILFPLETPLIPGPHTIKITAYDAVGNKGELLKEINLSLPNP